MSNLNIFLLILFSGILIINVISLIRMIIKDFRKKQYNFDKKQVKKINDAILKEVTKELSENDIHKLYPNLSKLNNNVPRKSNNRPEQSNNK